MKLIDNTPVGSKTSMVFASWRDDAAPYGLGSGVLDVTDPVYSHRDVQRGREVRAARLAAGLTIGEVARKLGLGAARYCAIERGAVRPDSEDGWRELFDAFGEGAK